MGFGRDSFSARVCGSEEITLPQLDRLRLGRRGTWANVVLDFTDGSRAIVTASFAMLGGVRNTFEVYTSNAAIRSDMTSNRSMNAFTPDGVAFLEEELHEKVETQLGWNSVEADGGWSRGYPQEMQNFIESIAVGKEPESGLSLAGDVAEVIYCAYVSAAEDRRMHIGPRAIKRVHTIL